MGKGGQTTTGTSSQTWGPGKALLRRYRNLLGEVFNTGHQEYQGYEGQRVAEFTPDQLAAMQGVRNAQGIATPYYNRAEGLINKSAVPTYQTYQNYMNPYTQDVVDATQRQFAAQNQEQQQDILGNAVAKGAMGGDRVGVAQGEAVRQQALAQDPMIANLYSQGFDKSIAAAQADAARYGQAGQQMMGLGSQAQNSAYIDANQLMGSGNTQQQQNQAGLNVNYQNFLEERAFPYQQQQYMAQMLGSLGPQMGGHSSGTTTSTTPEQSPWQTVAGLGMAAAGVMTGNPMMVAGGIGSASGAQGSNPQTGYAQPQSYSAWGAPSAGGFNFSYSDGGRVRHRATGGGISLPYGDEGTEDLRIPRGGLAPGVAAKPPSMPTAPSAVPGSSSTDTTSKLTGQAMNLASKVIGGFKRGGLVGYADGGDVDDDDYGDAAPGMDAMAFAPPSMGGGLLPPPQAAAASRPVMGGFGSGTILPPVGGYNAAAPAAPTGDSGGGLFNNPDLGKALMAAGFATMASKAGSVGQAIGEGGLTGLKTYSGLKEAGEKSKIAKNKAAMDAQKLAQSAKDTAARLAETSRHNRASEGVAYENLKRGNYDLIPGSGKDENGETVPGSYKFDKKTGSSTFQPGVSVTRKGDADIDKKLDSQERRTGMTVEGANTRNERTVAGAGDRNAASIEARKGLTQDQIDAADRREQQRIDAANARNTENNTTRKDIASGNNETRKGIATDNNAARAARATAGGPGGGVSKWKYDAYLAGHPGDTDGALDYASGRRKMGDSEINKAAIGMAAKEANDFGYEGDERKKFIQKRTREYGDVIRQSTPVAEPPAVIQAPAKKPTASVAPPAAAAKPDTSQVIAKARDAISRGAPRDAVIQRLKAAGIDATGL